MTTDLIDINESDLIISSNPSLRDIFALQKYLTTLEQFDFNQHLRHTFSEGAYARELLLPKDMLIIGKIHRHGHLNIISKGFCTVWTTDGLMQIDAREHPVTFVSTPGTKRVVYANEDTVWTTIHLTNETDLDKIEAEIIVPESDYQELIDSIPMPILEIAMKNKLEVLS